MAPTGFISIYVLVLLVAIPVGIISSVVWIKVCGISVGIKKYKSIYKEKEEEAWLNNIVSKR